MPKDPKALGDLRRRNGATATILKPELLARLGDRLCEPPPDGGLWSSRKVANWMAGELGLTSVAPQRGWEALKAIGWSIQKPRPKNPKSASPEEAAAFKKSLRTLLPKKPQSTPAKKSRSSRQTSIVKPVTRRVWAPIGERPMAHGHHRFDWLYVTAFASPATGETFWYLSTGVSKEFFEALLETFAREAEAGLSRIILLVLDNARRLTLTGSTLRARSVQQKAEVATALREKIWPLLDKGLVKPLIHATFPLEQARQAHEMMESSSHLGKILLVTGK